MTTVSSVAPRTRRNVELVLLLLAVGIVVLAYVNVGLSRRGRLPARPGHPRHRPARHLARLPPLLRWRAAYADPLLLPIVTLLNGLGPGDDPPARHRRGPRPSARAWRLRQLTWSALAVGDRRASCCIFLRDHRHAAPLHLHRGGRRFRPAPPAAAARASARTDQRLAHLDPAWGRSPSSPVRSPRSCWRLLRRLPRADPRRPVAGRPQGPRVHLPARPRPRPDHRRLGAQPRRPRLREGPRLLAAVLRAVRRDALRRHRAHLAGSPSA